MSELNKTPILCPHCEGTGIIESEYNYGKILECPYCKGQCFVYDLKEIRDESMEHKRNRNI